MNRDTLPSLPKQTKTTPTSPTPTAITNKAHITKDNQQKQIKTKPAHKQSFLGTEATVYCDQSQQQTPKETTVSNSFFCFVCEN